MLSHSPGPEEFDPLAWRVQTKSVLSYTTCNTVTSFWGLFLWKCLGVHPESTYSNLPPTPQGPINWPNNTFIKIIISFLQCTSWKIPPFATSNMFISNQVQATANVYHLGFCFSYQWYMLQFSSALGDPISLINCITSVFAHALPCMAVSISICWWSKLLWFPSLWQWYTMYLVAIRRIYAHSLCFITRTTNT